MQMNALHMRFAAIASGIVLIAGYMVCGGSTGSERIVQIDFSMDPQFFEGLQVEINGEVVGQLEAMGNATRSGFEVDKGEQIVRVLHPEMDCEPAKLVLDRPGEKARLLLQVDSRYDSVSRTSRPMLFLEY